MLSPSARSSNPLFGYHSKSALLIFFFFFEDSASLLVSHLFLSLSLLVKSSHPLLLSVFSFLVLFFITILTFPPPLISLLVSFLHVYLALSLSLVVRSLGKLKRCEEGNKSKAKKKKKKRL